MRKPPEAMLAFSCSRMPFTFVTAASVRLITELAPPDGNAVRHVDVTVHRRTMQPADSSLLSLSADALLARVETSGLRGRGGAHFPTAAKWRAVRCEPVERHLVANGHEGEPGSIK